MDQPKRTTATHRRWSLAVIGCVLLFVVGNQVLWVTKTGDLFLYAPNAGDLARVGYCPSPGTPKPEVCTLPKRQLTFDDVKPGIVDIVTVGDSISRGRGCGLNNFYQDHISSIHGLSTLHLIGLPDADDLQATVILHNSGLLRLLGTKHLILQSAERHAVERLERTVDWSKTRLIDELWKFYLDHQELKVFDVVDKYAAERERILHERGVWSNLGARFRQFVFMHIDRSEFTLFQDWCKRHFGTTPYDQDPIANDGMVTSMPKAINANMKFVLYKFFHWLDLKGQQPIMNLYEVDRPLFAEADGRQFLTHVGDLRQQVLAERPGWMEKMHDNLNRLAKLLREDGIMLHVMISPNKLTVYQPYLTDKSVPRNIFFDRMRSFTDREYQFIDTEKVIADLVARGEKDVYFAGDNRAPHDRWSRNDREHRHNPNRSSALICGNIYALGVGWFPPTSGRL